MWFPGHCNVVARVLFMWFPGHCYVVARVLVVVAYCFACKSL